MPRFDFPSYDDIERALERQANFQPVTVPKKVGTQTHLRCAYCDSPLMLFGDMRQIEMRGLNASTWQSMRALVCPVCDAPEVS